jgi:hypothetical protein
MSLLSSTMRRRFMRASVPTNELRGHRPNYHVEPFHPGGQGDHAVRGHRALTLGSR